MVTGFAESKRRRQQGKSTARCGGRRNSSKGLCKGGLVASPVKSSSANELVASPQKDRSLFGGLHEDTRSEATAGGLLEILKRARQRLAIKKRFNGRAKRHQNRSALPRVPALRLLLNCAAAAVTGGGGSRPADPQIASCFLSVVAVATVSRAAAALLSG